VIVDAGMNDLIRRRSMTPITMSGLAQAPRRPRIVADVVGPVADPAISGADRALVCRAGDLLAVMTAGAYGAVQAGTDNTRPLVAEVMVDGDRFAIVRPRLEVDEIIALDRLPDWM
jgi:diaminopimelate decarboxylase